MSANKLGHKQGAMLCSLASKLRHKSVGFTFNLQSSNANTRSVPFSKFQLLPQQEICEDYECTPRPLLEFRPFQLPGSTQNLDNQKPQDEANMYKHVQMEIKLIEMSHFVSFSCIINTIQHHSTVRFGDEFRTYRVLQKKQPCGNHHAKESFQPPIPLIQCCCIALPGTAFKKTAISVRMPAWSGQQHWLRGRGGIQGDVTTYKRMAVFLKNPVCHHGLLQVIAHQHPTDLRSLHRTNANHRTRGRSGCFQCFLDYLIDYIVLFVFIHSDFNMF